MSDFIRPEGRPRKYTNSEDLQAKIDEYFSVGVKTKTIVCGPKNNRFTVELQVPTITGLVLYCGFSNRQSFYDYEKLEEFSDTIKKARTRIEQEYEEQLQAGLGSGAIFALKNFGWIDEQKVEHSGGVTVQMGEVRMGNRIQEFIIG